MLSTRNLKYPSRVGSHCSKVAAGISMLTRLGNDSIRNTICVANYVYANSPFEKAEVLLPCLLPWVRDPLCEASWQQTASLLQSLQTVSSMAKKSCQLCQQIAKYSKIEVTVLTTTADAVAPIIDQENVLSMHCTFLFSWSGLRFGRSFCSVSLNFARPDNCASQRPTSFSGSQGMTV